MDIVTPAPHDVRMILNYYDQNEWLFNKMKSALFIGIRPGSEEMYVIEDLRYEGVQCLCFEAWRPNCERCHDDLFPAPLLNLKLEQVADVLMPGSIDLIWAKQVMERVEAKEANAFLEDAKTVARNMVIVETPYGVRPQGPFDGNPLEEHKLSVYPSFFEEHGYETFEAHEVENPTPGDPPRHALLGVWYNEEFKKGLEK